MNRNNFNQSYPKDESQDMIDLENSRDQHIMNFDQDSSGEGGQQFHQNSQFQERTSNAYIDNNHKEKQTYRNPYSDPQIKPPLFNTHPHYNDVKSDQPIYVPPFLKENQPLRRDKHNNVNDFLFWSVANIFICVVFALPALFFSVQTRDNKKAGNQLKAKSYSKRALILNIFASTIGLLTISLALIMRFALYHLFVQGDVNSQNVPLYNPYNPYKGIINK